MENDLITLNPPEEQPSNDLIALDTPVQMMSEEVANAKAQRIHIGAGDLIQRSKDHVKHLLTQGGEDDLRLELAATLERRKQAFIQDKLVEIAGKVDRLTPADVNHVKTTVESLMRPHNTETVFEELFSKESVGHIIKAAGMKPDTFFDDAMKEMPEQVAQLIDVGASAAQYREYALTKWMNATEVVKEQSWPGYVADIAKQMFPGYLDVKFRGSVEGTGFFEGGLLGDNIEAQAVAILNKPFDKFKDEFDRIFHRLLDTNPLLAVQFARAVAGRASSDIHLDNIFNLVDLTTLPWIKGTKALTSSAKRKMGMYEDVAGAIKKQIKETSGPDVNPVVLNEASGNLKEAAIQKVTADVIRELEQNADPVQAARETLPAHLRLDAEAIEKNPGSRSRELITRLKDSVFSTATNVLEAFARIGRIETMPEMVQMENAVRLVEEHIGEQYKGMDNRLLNTYVYQDPHTRAWLYDFEFGTTGADTFASKKVALGVAKRMGIADGIPVEVMGPKSGVVQDGLGWTIRVKGKPVPERDDIFRETWLSTPSSKSSFEDSWINYYVSKLANWRTPEELLSQEHLINRKFATYAPSEYLKMIHAVVEPIQKLANNTYPFSAKRKKFKQFSAILDSSQKTYNPDTGKMGRFAEHPAELDQIYNQNFNRLPDDDEVEAYFAAKNFAEVDRIIRTVVVVRNKFREGVEQHRFFSQAPIDGTRIESPWFEGIKLKGLPGGDDVMLVVGKEIDKSYPVKLDEIQGGQKQWDEWTSDIEKGKRFVYEIYDPKLKPLNDWAPVAENKRIRYVMVEHGESKNLSWDQIPRQGGGHFDYDYPFYIKQAKVLPNHVGTKFSMWYEGDTTIMPVQVRAMGEEIVKHLNEVRIRLKNDDVNGAKQYAEDHELPYEWQKLKGMFEDKHVNGKKQPAMLSKDEPIQSVERDQLIIDKDATLTERYSRQGYTFKDGTSQGSRASQAQVQYTGERDAYEVFTIERRPGSRQEPLFDPVEAEMISVIPSMNRALSRIVNSVYLDDYKSYAVNRWLKEAAPWIETNSKTDSEIWHSPFKYFHHHQWKTTMDIGKRDQLEAQHHHIKQLLGTPSSTDTYIQRATQMLADTIYKQTGKTAIIPDALLPMAKDPIGVLRAMTVHAKMGLFAIPQLMVQNQTWVTIAAVAGWNKASSGAYATLLHQWSRINGNPAYLAKLDEYAAKLHMPGTARWKLGEFTEARELGESVGIFNVGREYALLDNPLSHKIVSRGKDKFLDWGMMFFREGERNVRIGAWYTAYREFKDLNPGAVIDDAAVGKILQRADFLTVNMTRASNSMLHQGIMSIPTQFLTYQIRLAEMFFGKRLGDTLAERTKVRARMLLWNAGVYGLPTTAAVTGLPLGDWFRQTALEHGTTLDGKPYVVGDRWIESAVMEGIPSMLVALATGKHYNIGDRYGVQGFELLREALRNDKTMWELAGGAAWSTMSNSWTHSSGLRRSMVAMLQGNPGAHPIKIQDLVDTFKEVSSVASLDRAYIAWNTGRYISKQGNYVDKDMTATDIAFNVFLGLSPQGVTDMNIKGSSLKSQAETDKALEKQYSIEVRRALLAADAKNWNLYQQHMARAQAVFEMGGFPNRKRLDSIRKAMDDNRTLIERIDERFYIDNAPDAQAGSRLEAFGKILKQKQGN